jgi:hypothetical protein
MLRELRARLRPPRAAKTVPPAELKAWAAIVLALGGLVTAVGAVVRPRPESEARAAYLELTKSILDTQSQAKQDHEDLEALHGFVAAYIESHKIVTVETPATPTPAASASSARSELAPSGLPSTGPSAPALYSKMAVVFAAPSSAVPPPIAPLREQRKPKNADAVFH